MYKKGSPCKRCATTLKLEKSGRCLKCTREYGRSMERHKYKPILRGKPWTSTVCQARQNHERLKDMRDIAGPDYSLSSIKI